MDITINTPALLFPAISLIMLAYTNRFLALAALVRELHRRYKADEADTNLQNQIKNLKLRLRMIKNMQFFGVMSFLFSLVSMYLIYIEAMSYARLFFAISVVMFAISLIISLLEINRSTKALEIELRDIQDSEGLSLKKYFKKES